MSKQITIDMKVLFSLLIFLFTGALSYAQGSLSGRVVNSDGEPIELVAVTINGVVSDTTNEQGEFSFEGNVPIGQNDIEFIKADYEIVSKGIEGLGKEQVLTNPIVLELTKKKQRELEREAKKAEKEKRKEERKENRSGNGFLFFGGKDKDKSNNLEFDVIEPEEDSGTKVENVPELSEELKQKYSAMMEGVPDEQFANARLYEFIDEWIDVPYAYSGGTKEGVDCSSFVLRLHGSVFQMRDYPGRNSQEMFALASEHFSWSTLRFMKEGDLIFFNKSGSKNEDITHVGVYLGNEYFVHSPADRDPIDGTSGVQISRLTDAKWKKQFVAFRVMDTE